MRKLLNLKKAWMPMVLSMALCCAYQVAEAQTCKLVLDENFNHYSGSYVNYTMDMLRADFNGVNSRAAGEVRGIDGDGKTWPSDTRVGNGVLRANYPANIAGGSNSGFLFDKTIESSEEAVMEYKVRFEGTGSNNDFVWAAGGKLPGLAGSATTSGVNIPVGCTDNQSVIDNGFSARLMWRRGGELVVYTYFPDRDMTCGEDLLFYTAKVNQWYTIRQYIKLNTPGVRNGIIEMYVNGQRVYRKADVLFRLAGKTNVKINDVVFHTYRGGKPDDTRFHSPNNDHVQFDDFKVWVNCSNPNTTPPDPCAGNTLPSVSITAPVNNGSFVEGTSLTLAASASDNGQVTQVEFFDGTISLGKKTQAPFSISVSTLMVGTHTLSAKATDNCNGVKTSTLVSISITSKVVSDPCVGKTPPTVSISAPANNATFDLGKSINVNVDAGGSVALTKVELFNGTTLLGSDPTSPYTFVVSSLAEGTHIFTAKAFDQCSKTTVSSGVTVVIRKPAVLTEPILGPGCGKPNQSLSFELNTAYRENAKSYSWWFSGPTQSITPSATGTSCLVVPNQYFTSGEVCVGVNISVAPYYQKYCKSVNTCAVRIGLDDGTANAALPSFTMFPNPANTQSPLIIDASATGLVPRAYRY